jgi:hypothetical protein
VSWLGAYRAQLADALQCMPSVGFRLTPHDRHLGFGRSGQRALDMGSNLVAEAAVRRRAELGGRYAATRKPDARIWLIWR